MNQEICAISFIKEKIILSVVVLRVLQRKFQFFKSTIRFFEKLLFSNKPNQQYKVTKYGYTKMTDLPFDFTAGRCQGLSQSAVLCSAEQADRKCWQLTGSGLAKLFDGLSFKRTSVEP